MSDMNMVADKSRMVYAALVAAKPPSVETTIMLNARTRASKTAAMTAMTPKRLHDVGLPYQMHISSITST